MAIELQYSNKGTYIRYTDDQKIILKNIDKSLVKVLYDTSKVEQIASNHGLRAKNIFLTELTEAGKIDIHQFIFPALK